MKYRPDIDGLRAVAVLSVLLFHAELGFPGGYVGVDVFFVISGYLITGIIKSGLDRGSFSLADFWRRRIARIVPAATVTVLATVVAGWFLLMPGELAELAGSAVAQQLTLANLHFSQRIGYFDGPADLKPLLHMWSLAVEEQFYLFYPFLLVLLHRKGNRFTAVALGLIAAASFAYSVQRLGSNPSAAFFLLPSRIWELVLGGILHWLPPLPEARTRVRTLLSAIGLAGVLASATLYSKETPFPATAALLPCIGTALLLHSGGTGNGVARLLSLRVLVLIGLISYSLYLVHWPLLAYLRHEFGLSLPLEVRLVAIAISLALAAISWWLVEVPARSFGTRQPVGRVVLAFAISVAALGGSFTLVSTMDGFPGRFPERIARIQRTPGVDASQERSAAQVIADDLPLFGDRNDGIDCLLWGDSHARALAEAFTAACNSLDLSGAIATRSATLPLLDVWRPGKRESSSEWNAAVLDFVRRNRVRVVVLVGRWSMNIDGTPVAGGRGRIVMDSDTLHRDPSDAERVVRDGLVRTVDAIRSAGASVVLVREFPLQPIDGRRLLVRELQTGQPSPMLVRRSGHRLHQASVERAFAPLEGMESLQVVDPSRRLFLGDAPESLSIVGDEDGSYYADENHPSAYGGVKIVAPELVRAMRDLLR